MIRIKDKEFVLEQHDLFKQKERRRVIKKWGEDMGELYDYFEGYATKKPVELRIPAKNYFKTKPADPVLKEAWEENLMVEIYF